MGSVLQFISDNRDVLTWLGGGLVVVAGGGWTVVRFVLKNRKAPTVSVDRGVMVGRDIRGGTITVTNAPEPGKRKGG